MAFRSRQLFGLLRQAMSSSCAVESGLVLSSGSRAPSTFSRSAILAPPGLQPFRRFAYGGASQVPGNPAQHAAYLRELNSQSTSGHIRVVELFEGGQVSSNDQTLCEYVRALSFLNKLDGSLVGATLARGAHTGSTPLAHHAATAASQELWQRDSLGHARTPDLFDRPDQGLGGGLGTAAKPIIFAKKERSFFEQLWQTLRVLLVTFIVISALYAMADERGIAGRGMLQNPDLKPQMHSDTKFADVKGVDEAKEELVEVVEYLKNPGRFTALGGKLPKGVLLMGPPGTGKTMLARAIAGEAGVPFFYTSGSEFEEMFVGVGARRVRDLFKAAKAHAPCIIFIDEIDAIGGSRSPKDTQYMKMTLNQMLVELDGFKASEGVIVVAATNFPESLDKALVRPGRFDRHVVVPNPDIRGREQILASYFKSVRRAPDVNLELIARGTPGFSGADLANLVNVAALKAAREGQPHVTQASLEYAKDRIMMGVERKSMVVSEESRRLTAYHEGGHALVALHTRGANDVGKATIVPRGMAMGMVMQVPSKDDTGVTRQQLLARLDVCMGGRVAEELIFGADNVTTGAVSDLDHATQIARAMVTQYGFSRKLGHLSMSYEKESISTETRALIEGEVKQLVEDAYERAKQILSKHEGQLHRLAKELIDKETLTGDEIIELLGLRARPAA